MVVKKIVQMCKKTGALSLWDDAGKGIQWIGNGFAIYPLEKMPYFTPETVCRAYDISEKQAEKIRFTHSDKMPAGLNTGDIDGAETVVEPLQMTLIHSGQMVQPYMTSRGIKFMDMKYMEPIQDEGNSYVNVYERFTESGELYFVVKSGMLLVAVIMPISVISQAFINTLEQVYVKSMAMWEGEREDA